MAMHFDPEKFRQIVCASPFFQHLRMELLHFAEGEALVGLQVRPFHLNTQRIVHGGMLYTLADTAAAIAVSTTLLPIQRPRTLSMEIQYLSPGSAGRTLEAHGQMVGSKESRVLAEAAVRDESGKLLCTARSTYTIVGL